MRAAAGVSALALGAGLPGQMHSGAQSEQGGPTAPATVSFDVWWHTPTAVEQLSDATSAIAFTTRTADFALVSDPPDTAPSIFARIGLDWPDGSEWGTRRSTRRLRFDLLRSLAGVASYRPSFAWGRSAMRSPPTRAFFDADSAPACAWADEGDCAGDVVWRWGTDRSEGVALCDAHAAEVDALARAMFPMLRMLAGIGPDRD